MSNTDKLSQNDIAYYCARIADDVGEYFIECDGAGEDPRVYVYLAYNGSESYIDWSTVDPGSSLLVDSASYRHRDLYDADNLYELVSEALSDMSAHSPC